MSSEKKPDEPQGQVSEVGNLGDGGPISPEDATAGYPTSESGNADEGEAGPDAGASPADAPDRTSSTAPEREENPG